MRRLSTTLWVTLLLLHGPSCHDSSSGSSSNPAGSAPSTFFVDASAPGGGAGSGWSDAIRDLQDALAMAEAGDEIWVVAGTYRPGAAGGERTSHFALREGVELYGGFAGHETRRSQRDPRQPTMLSGDLNGDDGPDFTNRSDNAYQVVVAVDIDTAVLDGFVITGGHADGPGFGATPNSLEQGAGLNIYGSSPQVVDCIFIDNFSANHGTANDHGVASVFERCSFLDNRSDILGAGLYMHHHSRTIATHCLFVGNETIGEGAGTYTRSVVGAQVIDCIFRNNEAERGGGLYVADEATPTIEGCVFEDNVGRTGGGGIYSDQGKPLIRSSRFSRNQAGLGIRGGEGGLGGSGGGGVWTTGGAAVIDLSSFEENLASLGAGVYCIEDALTSVIDCSFTSNLAGEAGGIYNLSSPVIVMGCTFENNTAIGGDFSVGGGVSNYFSDALVEDCLFRGNHAWFGGGGVYNEGANPRIRRCHFEANDSLGTTEGWGGGLLDGFFTFAMIDDCVFVGNLARIGGAIHEMAFSEALVLNCTAVSNTADQASAFYAQELALTEWNNCVAWASGPDPVSVPVDTLEYSCVEGGWPGTGNHGSDPAFMRLPTPGADTTWGSEDDDYGDLRPSAASALLDAGTNVVVPLEIELDIAGHPRFVDDPAPDVGLGKGPLIDQGAYERSR